ncbi:MAG: STAS domain-containing protein [Anaerovoracaceae bacterium]
MEIIYEMTGDTLTAQLMGELDHHAAAKVRGDIDDTMDRYGAKNLIFDFSRVTFMDSAGIGVVLGRYKRLNAGGDSDAKCSGLRARGLSAGEEDDARSVGGKVVITGCSQKIYSILHMAGIFSLMKYTETKEEAVTYLYGRKEVC